MPADLRTRIGHLDLPSPILTASGCAGSGRELAQFTDVARIGAVITKSVTLEPKAGNPSPRMAETPSGLLSSVGPAGTGARRVPAARPALAAVARRPGLRERRRAHRPRVRRDRLPAVGLRRGDRARGEPRLPGRRGGGPAVRARPRGGGRRGGRRAGQRPLRHPGLRQAVTGGHRHRRGGPRLRGGRRGRAVDDQHAARDGDRPGDLPARPGRASPAACPGRPSGRSRCAASGWSARRCPTSRIIGCGGVRTGRDALEFLLAGAVLVAVGTVLFHDPSACSRIQRELEEELTARGVDRVSDVIGRAHQPAAYAAERHTWV